MQRAPCGAHGCRRHDAPTDPRLSHAHAEAFYDHLARDAAAAQSLQRAMSAFIAHGIDAIAVATEAAGLLSSALTVVDVGGPERSAARYGSSLQASALQLRRVLPTASPLSLLEAVPA